MSGPRGESLARRNGRVAYESGLKMEDSNPYKKGRGAHAQFEEAYKAAKRATEDAAFAKKYPLHVELKAREVERQTIANFLDWLDEKGLTICSSDSDGLLWADYVDKAKRIGAFMEIDPDALEAEKRAMLDELRGAAS